MYVREYALRQHWDIVVLYFCQQWIIGIYYLFVLSLKAEPMHMEIEKGLQDFSKVWYWVWTSLIEDNRLQWTCHLSKVQYIESKIHEFTIDTHIWKSAEM